MAAEKMHWRWWQKAILTTGLALLVLLGAFVGFRRPWVEPLPGVRIEMSRPFLRESDLGPDSAYKLLLRAIEEPAEATAIRDAGREWLWAGWRADPGWVMVLAKLEAYPWPKERPAAASPSPDTEGSDDEAAEAGMFSGTFEDSMKPVLPTSWTAEQYDAVRRLVEECRPDLAALDRALAAPNPQVPTPDSLDFPIDDYLRGVRHLAQYLAVSAQYRAATGDPTGACQDLVRLPALGNLVCRGGGTINHCVGWSCGGMAARAAWRIATRDPVPAAVLAQLARVFLASADDTEPFAEAIRVDLPMYEKHILELQRHSSFGIDMGVVGFPMSRPWGRALQRALFAALPLAGSTPERTRQNLRSWHQHVFAIAEKPYSAAVQAEYVALRATLPHPREWRKTVLCVKDPLGCIYACLFMSPTDTLHHQFTFHTAQLHGMALFLAIKAYEQEQGALPERLDQLVPVYLPRVPADPFDGKPFRYLRSRVPGLPPEAWAVYSIGQDFTDDGGTASSVGAREDSKTPNPDLVWPSQAYPTPAD